MADLGSSAGPAVSGRSSYQLPRQPLASTTKAGVPRVCVDDDDDCSSEEECRTLLDSNVLQNVEASADKSPQQRQLQLEQCPLDESSTNTATTALTPPSQPVQSTSHDLLVILNSPSSDNGGFTNMAA